MDVIVTRTPAGTWIWPCPATMYTMSAAFWNSAQLLDVHVNDFAEAGDFDASNHFAGRSVHPIQTMETVPAKHLVGS